MFSLKRQTPSTAESEAKCPQTEAGSETIYLKCFLFVVVLPQYKVFLVIDSRLIDWHITPVLEFDLIGSF